MKNTIFIIIFFATQNFLAQTSWIEQNSGVTVPLNSVFTSNWSQAAWICGNNGTVLRTTDSGTNWINVSGNGIPSNVVLNTISDCANYPEYAITAGVRSDTAIAYLTTNSGASWQVVLRQYGGYINGVGLSYSRGFIIGNPVGGRWTIYKTTNNGLNWDSTGMYLPQNNSETGFNNSFFINFYDVVFGTNNNRIYSSSNSGANWVFNTTAGSMNSSVLSSVMFGTATPFSGYIGGSQKILYTTNGGNNWIQDSTLPGNGNIVGIFPQPLPVDLGYYNLIVTRGDNKIYMQYAYSSGWTLQYTSPAGNYRHISNRLPYGVWAVRDNGGISYCGCMLGSVSQNEGYIPETYSLSQNYPNPFNPVTNIKFQIPLSRGVSAEGGRGVSVRLTVYDLLGREVQTLINQQMQPGSYNVDWDASNYPSGVYFYKLESIDFKETKRMVLAK